MTDRLARAIDDLRRRWVPDSRLGVFDVAIAPEGRALMGCTASRNALEALRRMAGELGIPCDVTLLPDETVGANDRAIAVAAVAPLLAAPTIGAVRASEALHGEVLAVLERRESWLRVRAPDGYHAWTQANFVATGPPPWAEDWERRATGRTLGAELRFEDGRLRLPIGARVALRRDGTVECADGRIGRLASGVVRLESEFRAEARLVASPEWALRWFSGAPYLWGGRTEWGVDCSGLVQAVYAARGVPLPRDADLQFGVGAEVPLDDARYEAGDLLFFAEEGRVAHVALWTGAGRIVHAALARGGVGTDDLSGDSGFARRLREGLVGVRRIERA